MNETDDFRRSLYLETHLEDKVKWNTWGEAALLKAKKADKPLFISIGYSSCHWCHVMEEQSFNNDDISAIMNEQFVPVIVDREERPDVDNFYMKISQTVNGTGGWPLNVIAMPDGKPFFVSTYIPPFNSGGEPGLFDILNSISQIWKEERGRIIEASTQITSLTLGRKQVASGTIDYEQYYDLLSNIYDRRNGGFGDAPKFPNFNYSLFLMRYNKFFGKGNSISMVGKTLKSIRYGGIYDHLASGIHRYSTDREWRIPHFEKMLYDQAMMIETLVEFYENTQEKEYLEYAREIIDFLFEYMQQDGLLISALDADFNGTEGLYYTWDDDELRKLLNESEFKILVENIDLSTKIENRVVLKGKDRKLSDEENDQLSTVFKKMKKFREGKGALRKDDKIILAWNCMAFSSIIHYSYYDKRYIDKVRNAIEIIQSEFVTSSEISRTVRKKGKGVKGMLEDYSYYANLLLNEYGLTLEDSFLYEAVKVVEMIKEKFLDKKNGGFFTSTEGKDIPVVREKGELDAVYPSGTAVLFDTLIKISLILEIPDLRDLAKSIIEDQKNEILDNPIGHISLISYMATVDRIMKISIPQKMNKEFTESRRVLFLPDYVFWKGDDEINICNFNSCIKNFSTLEEMWNGLKSRF